VSGADIEQESLDGLRLWIHDSSDRWFISPGTTWSQQTNWQLSACM